MSRRVLINVKPDDRAFKAAQNAIKKIQSATYRKQAVRPAVGATSSVANKALKAAAKRVGDVEIATKFGPKIMPARQLAKSIGVRRRLRRRPYHRYVVANVIGPRFGYTAPGGTQPFVWGPYIEGLKRSKALLSGPRPFARSAMRQAEGQMRSAFRRKLVKGTSRVVRKLRAKGVDL